MNELEKEKERIEALMKESLITGRIINKQIQAAAKWYKLNQQLNTLTNLIGKKTPEYAGLNINVDLIELPPNHPLTYAKECYPRYIELLGIIDDLEVKYNNYKIRLNRIKRQIAALNNNDKSINASN